MGNSLLNMLLLIAAFRTASAQFDSDFCARKMGTQKGPSPTDPLRPVFFDNFYAVIESKTVATKVVETLEEYYSQQAQSAYVLTRSPITPFRVWVNGDRDEVTMVPDTPDGEACTDTLLETSVFSAIYRVYPGPDEKHFDLNTPTAVFTWDSASLKNVSYIGTNTSRGIPTNVWWTCTYNPYNSTTMFNEWQIADPSNLVLPAIARDNSQAPTYILPISSRITVLDKSDPRNPVERVVVTDFTHFSQIQPDDRHFRLPTNMVCGGSPSSQIPLPQMPSYFRFRGEQVLIDNGMPITLTYTIEEYNHNLGLFTQDLIQVPDSTSATDKSYTRVVTDFNTGVTYTFDLSAGGCLTNAIDPNSIGAFKMASGFVQMRDSNQFFDLDSSSYTYLGLNYVEGRAIECDVWSMYVSQYSQTKAQYTLYTWYFASAAWMQSMGYQQTNPIPIMLELSSASRQVQFHFYEYSTVQSTPMPDVSVCFAPENTMNIQLFVFKARYDQVYKANPIGFRTGFLTAMTTFTSLKSGLRVADLDFQPAPNDEIQVQFKLLDKPSASGDVQNQINQAPNSQIFNELSDKINSGLFTIDVQNPPNQNLGKQTVYARPNSITVLSTNDVMNYTISFDPNNGNAHMQLSTPKSSGYSAGSMAGIGIGMLVTGILVGVLVIFLVRKFRGGSVGTGISLQKMENE